MNVYYSGLGLNSGVKRGYVDKTLYEPSNYAIKLRDLETHTHTNTHTYI